MKHMGNNNFSSLVTRGALNNPNKEVITFKQQRMTYRELQERVSALAQGLLDLGVKKGDVVAILLFNHTEYFEIIFAANRIGAIFLPLNFRLAADEIAYIADNADAKAIFSEDSFHETLDSIRGNVQQLQHYITLSANEPSGWTRYEQLIETNRGADVQDAHVELDDLHRLMYTSGTTSRPKGVMITYGNLYWKKYRPYLGIQYYAGRQNVNLRAIVSCRSARLDGNRHPLSRWKHRHCQQVQYA